MPTPAWAWHPVNINKAEKPIQTDLSAPFNLAQGRLVEMAWHLSTARRILLSAAKETSPLNKAQMDSELIF